MYGVFSPRHIVRKLDGKVLLDIRLPKTPSQNPYLIFPTPDVLRGTAKVAQVPRKAPPAAATPTPRRANGVPDIAGYWGPKRAAGAPAAFGFGAGKPTVDLGKVDYAVVRTLASALAIPLPEDATEAQPPAVARPGTGL